MKHLYRDLPAAIVALVLAVLAIPAAQAQKPLTVVRFGVSPFQDTLVPMFGQTKGWYAEEGLDVQFRILGWTEVQEALSSRATNRIDVGINNISSIIATHSRNPQLIYAYGFNTFDDGFALMVRRGGGLKPLKDSLQQGLARPEAIRATAAQLKGKTVITTSNTDMEQGVAAAARRGGLDFKKDITIINLPPDEGLAAFLSGQGDAYIGGVPQRTRAEKEGMIELLTGADIGPPPINGIVTTREYYERNKEALARLLKVWFRSVQYIDAHLDEGASTIVGILNKNSSANFTADDFKRFWNKIEHYPPTPEAIEADILSPQGKNYWRARWDDCNEYFLNIANVITKPVSPEEAFFMPDLHSYYLAHTK
jgi:NitT/TauT family transport system substrate-binding protein